MRRRRWLRLRRLPLIDPAGNAAGPGGPAGSSPGRRPGIRPLDLLIIAVAAVCLAVMAMSVYGGPPSSTLVVSTDSGEWIYPLSEDRTVEADGKLGVSVIHVEGGFAHIDESPCANKLCVGAAAIGRTGEWSACLPNGVFIRIEGLEADGDIDAYVR